MKLLAAAQRKVEYKSSWTEFYTEMGFSPESF